MLLNASNLLLVCIYVQNTAGWIGFLTLYAIVLLSSLETPSQMNAPSFAECSFWLWDLCMMLNELVQFYSDYDSFSAYLKGSGNAFDGFIRAFAQTFHPLTLASRPIPAQSCRVRRGCLPLGFLMPVLRPRAHGILQWDRGE